MSTFKNGQTVSEQQRGMNGKSEKAILNYISNSLRATRPWTRFFSVLGFIGTAVMILSGIGIILGGKFLQAPENAPLPALSGIINIVLSVFYLVPSIWLSKYSSAITRFLSGGGAIELGNAIAFQKSFWKFVGITTVVFIVIAVLGIIAAIFIPRFLSFI
jgi:hypothetical protein